MPADPAQVASSSGTYLRCRGCCERYSLVVQNATYGPYVRQRFRRLLMHLALFAPWARSRPEGNRRTRYLLYLVVALVLALVAFVSLFPNNTRCVGPSPPAECFVRYR